METVSECVSCCPGHFPLNSEAFKSSTLLSSPKSTLVSLGSPVLFLCLNYLPGWVSTEASQVYVDKALGVHYYGLYQSGELCRAQKDMRPWWTQQLSESNLTSLKVSGAPFIPVLACIGQLWMFTGLKKGR